MRLGFPRKRATSGFYSERNARVAVGSGRTAEIERASVPAQAGARSFAGPGPRCGLGAACAREEMGRAGFCWFLGQDSHNEPTSRFSHFSFSRKLKNGNWLKKKIEK